MIAFGTSLRTFIATYDAAKAADSRFVVGSDLRVTPDARTRSARYASQLRVGGVAGVSPVAFALENSLLLGAHQRARTDLAAIDPVTFGEVTRPTDSSFAGRSTSAALAALRADPRGLLVAAGTADELSIETGDRVRVVVALGTPREATATFRVVGLFTRLAGFARRPDLVAGLDAYAAAATATRVDFFLVRTNDHGGAGLARVAAAIRSGPGARGSLAIETTETARDRDQSSLTALDVRSLAGLGSLSTLLMSAAVIAIFAFGLILQRRREYVSLRAQGMHAGELRALVLGEVALVAAGGLVSGLLVGTGTAFLLVQVLRPLFVLPPGVEPAPGALVTPALATVAAALVCAFAAAAALRRIRPTDVLREP